MYSFKCKINESTITAVKEIKQQSLCLAIGLSSQLLKKYNTKVAQY
jgi:hypothetical protein